MAAPTTSVAAASFLSMTRRTVAHPNGQTSAYYYDSFTDPWKQGQTETILLQHGFGRTSVHFYHWVPALSRSYNVIRRDLRGHGGSSWPKKGESYDYSTATILGEIKDMLDQLGIQRIHFVGESTSGMLGMAFAAMFPDRLLSLTICSSPQYLPPASQRFLAFGEASWPEALRNLGSRGWAERLVSAPGTLDTSNAEPGYVEWWLGEVTVSDGDGLAGYAEFLCQFDARPYIKQIRTPMLILGPTNSALVSPESSKELAAQIPTATLELIQAKGHEIFSEESEKCQAALIKFIQHLP